MAALPGGEPPHPLPGRLVPALVFPDERGLARLQLSVKRSSPPLRGEGRTAPSPLEGEGWGEGDARQAERAI